MKYSIGHNTISMEELLGNSRMYEVPKFQRNYSWGEEQWEELWDDIIACQTTGREHYMGYIVVQGASNMTVQKVIDGQQRLATISILILSVIALLDELIEGGQDTEDNKKRREQLSRFLWVESAAKLTKKGRITLGVGDKDFYQQHLLELHKPSVMGRLSPSNKKMWDALEFFKERIGGHVGNNGEEIAMLLEDVVGKKLFFTEMTVSNNDTDYAYTIFETLNARGVELSSADLLKNYLFTKVAEGQGSESDFETLEGYWKEAITELGRLQPTTFFRHYYHSISGQVINKKNLFRQIRKDIETPEKAFDFIKKASDMAAVYAELRHPTDNFCNNKKVIDMLNTLTLFGVSSLYPLLLSAYQRWGASDKNFEQTLRNCVNLSFRRSVIAGKNAHDLEKAFTEAAAEVWKSQDATFSKDVLPIIKKRDISDDEFKSAFKKEIISQKKLVRYILFRIEAQMSEVSFEQTAGKYTIEHILPQHSGEKWGHFENPDDYVWRLGNMTLLDKAGQKNADNKSFPAKREVYLDSGFAMTRKVADYEEWNEDTIGRRQNDMATQAAGIWKLQ